MTFLEHFAALRRAALLSLVVFVGCSVAAFIANERIIAFIMEPLRGLPRGGAGSIVYAQGLAEGFIVQIKVALAAGLLFSLPFHLVNAAWFVFPALSRGEKLRVLAALAVCALLVSLSFYAGYWRIVPVMVGFLSASAFYPPGVGMLPNYHDAVFFVIHFLLAVMLVFQLPVLLFALVAGGVVQRRALLKAGRAVVVVIFILAAVITPSPDFVSQLIIALPLTLLYFLVVLLAWVFRLGGEAA